MKKGLIFAILCCLAVTASAENREWYFNSWSATTIANIAADSDYWSDDEKGDGTTNVTGGTCYWQVDADGNVSEDGYLTANGTVIAELEGLEYTNTADRSLAIAINYPSTSLGDYNGEQYLWMGSSKRNYFIIPNVKPGATITAGVESHKPKDSRGINLYIGAGSSGTQLLAPDGSSVSTPTVYEEQTWYVPTDATDTANEDGTYDIQIYNTNGCHIYYLIVNEDLPSVTDASLVYTYNSSVLALTDDAFYDMLVNNENFSNVSVAAIDAAGDVSAVDAATLEAYDAVIVAPSLQGTDALAATVKEAIAYVPMLNLNPTIYEGWGYGTATTTTTNLITIPELYLDYELFQAKLESDNYINEDGTLALFEEGVITGVTIPEGSYFASDRVYATADDAVVSHIHSPAGKNSYLLLSYGLENSNWGESVLDLVTNGVTIVYATKDSVTAAATPVATQSYKQLNTDVKLTCSTSGAVIYYTLDGTDPTSESTLYEGVFNVSTEGTVVKAIAYADGYTASEILEQTISIYTTTDAPTISVEQGDGVAYVTLSTTTEDATIFYNITGSDSETYSTAYSSPLEITRYTTVTAFTGANDSYIQSEAVSAVVYPTSKEIRVDEVAHFDANATDWSGGESKTKYYTDGKKNGYNYYTVEETTGTASDGSDSTIYIKTDSAQVLTVWNPGNGWEAKSYGQGMLWQLLTADSDIDDTNTTARYRAEDALSAGASSNNITFGNVQKSDGVNNDPYSCSIQSTTTFKGPFDVVVYVGNGSSSNNPKALLCVSTDTLDEANWVEIDTIYHASTYRYLKRNVISYEGTDEVYIKVQAAFSSVMVFDIYVYNHGEESEALSSGIREINVDGEAAGEVISTAIYSINGAQLNSLSRGVNIIREVYSNGAVKTRKVLVQ